MNASKISKILGIVSIVAVGIAVVSCELGQPPPEMARPVICNGQPDWCLVVKSELDAHRPAYIYMDGEMQGLVLPSNTKRIPVKGGETHQISFCAYLPVGTQLQWKCSTPTQTSLDSDDSILIEFPVE